MWTGAPSSLYPKGPGAGPWGPGAMGCRGAARSFFFGIIICLSGQGVAEDSAVSTLAVKQNGAILNDSLLVGPLRVESYPKVTPPPPLYPNYHTHWLARRLIPDPLIEARPPVRPCPRWSVAQLHAIIDTSAYLLSNSSREVDVF